MNKFLFEEFDTVSATQWKQKIQFDLKGAEYNKTLLTPTLDGITIKPFYHADEIDKIEVPEIDENYKICQTIFISDEVKANSIALDSLKRGAQSIQFIAQDKFNASTLFNSIFEQFPETEIHFDFKFLDQIFTTQLIHQLNEKKIFYNIDLIGNLAETGNWYHNLKIDHEIVENLIKSPIKNQYLLAVNTSIYQNAGANNIQQIAYALAQANEYLNHFGSTVAQQIQFHFSVGSNYFFEISKLRAFRYLWKLLLDEYNIDAEPKIFVEPTLRNKTLYDYNTNMLRTTTECMSAILGGVTTISNVSYDRIFSKRNEFGERIARNQLLILKEESYFKDVNQIAKNSYYIESITKQMAEKSLALFKEIEQSGGFLKQLKEGTIQRKVTENAKKEQELFDEKKIILLGTNKYPNLSDQMKSNIEIYPFVRKKVRKTLISPIIQVRLAEQYEQKRLENEA
ncbi:MAG: methylmalonyl-CoA mutase subunit beta [Flavobacteriaceae bacterium]|nr:methylmalonyl-CoA mutase subunit beta [Flavobacteriaceae bacterium]